MQGIYQIFHNGTSFNFVLYSTQLKISVCNSYGEQYRIHMESTLKSIQNILWKSI